MSRITSRKSFYVRIEKLAATEEDAKQGLKWLLSYPNDGKAFIGINQKSDLESYAIAGIALGDFARKRLKNNQKAVLNNIPLEVIISRDVPFSCYDNPILAIAPTKEFLDKLDSISRVSALGLVPYTMGEAELWIKTWNAREIGSPTNKTEEAEPIQNPVVRIAVSQFGRAANKDTGITHPRDRDMAVETFEKLLKGGFNYDPDQVMAHLVRQGWTALHARQVSDLSREVLNGKKFRIENRMVSDVIELWKNEAQRESVS